jgi:hypothetical protein
MENAIPYNDLLTEELCLQSLRYMSRLIAANREKLFDLVRKKFPDTVRLSFSSVCYQHCLQTHTRTVYLSLFLSLSANFAALVIRGDDSSE